MEMNFVILTIIAVLFLCLPLANAATLSLSPTTGNINTGGSFSVNILLDTQSQKIDGTDAVLSYNPSIMEIQDSNATAGGVQISAGTLMPIVTYNIVDATAGKILFSQIPTPGTTYNGSGTLATVNFKALAAGSAAVSFDFIPGNTTDSNVAFNGTDVLTSVTNGVYTLAGQTVPPSQPPSGGGPSGGGQFTCNKAWQCTEWSACTDNKSTRTCNFVSVPQYVLSSPCPIQSKTPYTDMRCVSNKTTEKITTNCNDGIKNQDEEGIDCGGVCKPCSFQENISVQPKVPPPQQPEDTSFEFITRFASYSAIGLIMLGIVIFLVLRFRPKKLRPKKPEKIAPEASVPEALKNLDQKTSDSVISYIREARSKGLSDEYIRNSLLQAGIDSKVVEWMLKNNSKK